MSLVPCEQSFRDPGGFVFRDGSRIFRAIEPSAFETLEQFLASAPAQEFTAARQMVATWLPDSFDLPFELPANYRLAEHECISFPSFPAEWPVEMLASAGFLTLDLAEKCLPHGWRLKDATPYNVLFRGSSPVFVDVLSFERHEPGDPIWPAYAQFVRTFLLPLLAERRSVSTLNQIWLAHRDGLEPEQVYRSLSWAQRLTGTGLAVASVPSWFSSSFSSRVGSDESLYRPRRTDPERATFTVSTMYRRLRRQITRLSSGGRSSNWTKYLDTQTHYTAEQLAAKESFVASALREFAPSSVLDIGANTGYFSELAARSGASVVSIDSDPAVVGRIWQRASENSLNILPLVVDLCRPTPALGWRNAESTSFLDRARGHFDMCFMLAVVHHILISERVPLDEILALAAQLTTNVLVMEFVELADPMFRRLTRGRDALYAHLTASHFESVCSSRFQILRKQPLGESRRIYLLRRKI